MKKWGKVKGKVGFFLENIIKKSHFLQSRTFWIFMAPRIGFEPMTQRLTAVCSTTELPRKIPFSERKPAYIMEKDGNVKKNYKKRPR
ncbi:MAG: hypothetical protein ACD_78C00196G0004 [uncultured bacterium (gcode 4)]|uniref:Uncharacterized protein n=1 Tax=uncultured bacterium (gcode 4) TaxID=1234023 RepID=K1XXS2_9BACT|nr:MAG: hypothetical protein ACD_78C00196G0004 [uncultured bacterium (gcode 4)]